jgi:hypothetical protein
VITVVSLLPDRMACLWGWDARIRGSLEERKRVVGDFADAAGGPVLVENPLCLGLEGHKMRERGQIGNSSSDREDLKLRDC